MIMREGFYKAFNSETKNESMWVIDKEEALQGINFPYLVYYGLNKEGWNGCQWVIPPSQIRKRKTCTHQNK